MPVIGDLRRGADIGKNPKYGWFCWVACPTCGTERWCVYIKHRSFVKYPHCAHCGRAVRDRTVATATPIGSIAYPAIGDIRYGQEIGKVHSTRYEWSACIQCGRPRWVRVFSLARQLQMLCFYCKQRKVSIGRVVTQDVRNRIGKGVAQYYVDNPDRRLLRSLVAKAREPRRGWHHTESTKSMLRIKNAGPNSPNWRGGTSYYPYLLTFNNEQKITVFRKYGNRCFVCGALNGKGRGKKHNVHHIDGDKHNDDIKNLVELCVSCHRALHEWIKRVGIPQNEMGTALRKSE